MYDFNDFLTQIQKFYLKSNVMIIQTFYRLIVIDRLICLLAGFPQRCTLTYVCFDIKVDITFNVYEIALVISIYLKWKT